MLSTLKQPKNIVLAITIVLGLFLAYTLRGIFTGILGTIIIYTLFRPMNVYLIGRKKWNRTATSLFIIFISFIILLVPFFTLTWLLVDQIVFYKNNPEIVMKVVNKVGKFLSPDFNESGFINSALTFLENFILGSFTSILNVFLNTLLQVGIMYFILFYMFRHYDYMERVLLKYFPFSRPNSLILARQLKNVTFANVVGQGLSAFSQGLMLGVGFYIFGVRGPIFWGVVATFLSFLPIIGAQLVFVPAALILLAFGNTFQGVAILIWGFVLVTNIDNLVRLIVSKKLANIHPLITIIGIVIGLPMFGIVGLVIGPLLFSYFLLLVGMYEKKTSIAYNAMLKEDDLTTRSDIPHNNHDAGHAQNSTNASASGTEVNNP